MRRYLMDTRVQVTAIAVLAVVLRLGWQLRTGFYDGPLAFEEDEIARNILAGRGYVYYYDEVGRDFVSFGLTGLPLFLALLHLFDPGYTLIGIVQACLSAIVVACAYQIGRRLLSTRAGVLAALAVAVHPALIIMAARAVISPVYDHAVAGIAFVTALALVRDRTRANTVRFGLAGALGAFMRPTVAAAVAAAIALMALRPPRRPLAIAVALLIAVPVAMAVRNSLALGPVGSTSMFCVQLWIGNNPNASGGAYAREGRVGVFDVMSPELRAAVGSSEPDLGGAFCRESLGWLSEDIPRAVAWQATKFFYFWWFSPLAGILYPPGWIEAYVAIYSVEVALAVLGGVVVWRRGARSGLLVLLLMMATIAAAQVVFYVEGRHRLIVEAPLAALACCGIVSLLDRMRDRLAFARLRLTTRSDLRSTGPRGAA